MNDYVNVLVSGEKITHRMMIRKPSRGSKSYEWADGYLYRGYIWGLKYPKIGRIFQNQHGDRFKVIKLGADWNKRLDKQVECAYVIPWSGT